MFYTQTIVQKHKDVLRAISLPVWWYHDSSVLGSCIVTFQFICACFITGNTDSELGQSCLQETHRSYLADHNVLLRVEKKSTEVEHKLLLHGMDCDLSLPLYKLFHWSLPFVSPCTDRQNYLETPFRCIALCSLKPWSRADLYKDQMLKNTADFKCHFSLFPTSNWPYLDCQLWVAHLIQISAHFSRKNAATSTHETDIWDVRRSVWYD